MQKTRTTQTTIALIVDRLIDAVDSKLSSRFCIHHEIKILRRKGNGRVSDRSVKLESKHETLDRRVIRDGTKQNKPLVGNVKRSGSPPTGVTRSNIEAIIDA